MSSASPVRTVTFYDLSGLPGGKLLGERQLEKEIEAFGESKHNYLTAIIDNITMRFLNLSNELQDFLVLHSASQGDTEERLRSLVNRINKPGLTFESLLKQWKL